MQKTGEDEAQSLVHTMRLTYEVLKQDLMDLHGMSEQQAVYILIKQYGMQTHPSPRWEYPLSS